MSYPWRGCLCQSNTSVRRARNSETSQWGAQTDPMVVWEISIHHLSLEAYRDLTASSLTTWNSEETHLSWLTHTFHQQGCLVPYSESACSLIRSLILWLFCISRCVPDRENEKPQVSSQVSNPHTGQPHPQPHAGSPEASPVHPLL